MPITLIFGQFFSKLLVTETLIDTISKIEPVNHYWKNTNMNVNTGEWLHIIDFNVIVS